MLVRAVSVTLLLAQLLGVAHHVCARHEVDARGALWESAALPAEEHTSSDEHLCRRGPLVGELSDAACVVPPLWFASAVAREGAELPAPGVVQRLEARERAATPPALALLLLAPKGSPPA